MKELKHNELFYYKGVGLFLYIDDGSDLPAVAKLTSDKDATSTDPNEGPLGCKNYEGCIATGTYGYCSIKKLNDMISEGEIVILTNLDDLLLDIEGAV